MGFTDDRQLATCCRALCGRAGLARYWTIEAPTEAALSVRDRRDPLSHGESMFVRAAWALWNGEGGLKLGEIIEVLDADHAEAICKLVVAAKRGGRAVGGWLERFGMRANSRRSETRCLRDARSASSTAQIGHSSYFNKSGRSLLPRCFENIRSSSVTAKLVRHADQLSALGHPVRLKILRFVVKAGTEGAAAGAIQSHVDLPASTLSHHLKRLLDAGLFTTRGEGTFHYYAVNYTALRDLTDYVWEDCCKGGGKASCC